MMVIKIKNKQSLISRKLENKISKIKNSGFGFTLIELLVVISIIGILAALGIASYSRAEKNTRDAQRKSDLNQYRLALESYAAANNSNYPGSSSIPVQQGYGTEFCDFVVGTSTFKDVYLSGQCLKDPLLGVAGAGYTYHISSVGTKYYLWANLEKDGGVFLVCSNGISIVISNTRDGLLNGDLVQAANCKWTYP